MTEQKPTTRKPQIPRGASVARETMRDVENEVKIVKAEIARELAMEEKYGDNSTK